MILKIKKSHKEKVEEVIEISQGEVAIEIDKVVAEIEIDSNQEQTLIEVILGDK